MLNFVGNRSLPATLLVFLAFRYSLALTAESPCYNPDGQFAEGNFPCFIGQKQSACCGSTGICDASGLCKTTGSVGVSELIRGTCTDPTWASTECPLYCLDADTGGTNLISCANVTKSDLDFCCDHTTDCCDTGIGRFQVAANTPVITLSSGALFSTVGTAINSDIPISTTSISSSTIRSSTSASASASKPASSKSASSRSTPIATGLVESVTSSPTSTTATTPTSSAKSGVSSGAIAGIAGGVGAVALVGIIAGIYLCRRNRSKSQAENANFDSSGPMQAVDGYAYAAPRRSIPPQELDSDRNARGNTFTEYYKPRVDRRQPYELTSGRETDGRTELP